jgi:hypothetical protein
MANAALAKKMSTIPELEDPEESCFHHLLKTD